MCSEIWCVKRLILAFHDLHYMSTLRSLDSDLWEQLTWRTWQVDAKAVFGPGYDPLQVVKDTFNQQIDFICQLPHLNIMKSWLLRHVLQKRKRYNDRESFLTNPSACVMEGPEMDQPQRQQPWARNSTCHRSQGPRADLIRRLEVDLPQGARASTQNVQRKAGSWAMGTWWSSSAPWDTMGQLEVLDDLGCAQQCWWNCAKLIMARYCAYIYIYVYIYTLYLHIYIYTHIYIYIYIYI